jgi:signal transduction histidine kinase
MALGRKVLLSLLPWVGVVAVMGCRPSAEKQDELQWQTAETQWKRGEPTAYEAWRRLDPRQQHGGQAWARLQEADARYRRAVELLRAEQPGLRETLAEALALAPMDPSLYLPLARACRERGSLWRAVDFYRKYLARQPPLADAAIARAELAALAADDIPPEFDERPAEPAPVARGPREPWNWLAMAAAGLLFLLLVGAMTRRRRARPLRDIVIERPEVHQAVAYQIGCLRHEFLKHRIGAAGEALHALIRGQASPEQRRFLEERLCKGEPLLAAWRTHVGALERSLGLKFALTRGDPLFRGAQRALAVLGRVATMTRPADARRVEQARDSLERLDRELAELVARLAYCPVDEGFLRDVLVSTRSEWASGKVELDDISVGPVPEGVAVDVYRTDLRIVLKNILRNAISALAESPHPRRLAVDVLVDLEPTGEEVVRIRVRDSSTQPIEAEASTAAPTGVEHGLGIVRAALHRYDGSLEIAPGGDGYAKAVVVRLFRSQATHPEPLGEAA